MFDLRSDTVTRPTPAMRAAMAEAPVGDDVFGDDPTVHRLQDEVAGLLGKEAALFVPSGTMANAVAIRTHTQPGDEIIVEAQAHIYLYEGGGYAALAGCSIRTLPAPRGLLEPEAVRAAIRPRETLSHDPLTRLVCVENSHNRGGGTLYTPERLDGIAAVARAAGLALHLDGARLWNASIALNRSEAELAAPFDSVSVCLSKGLGGPVGSLLAGSRAFVARAHRFRKMFGGGMRQAGILAAAGLYALQHHRARLADDHARARRLAEGLAGAGLGVDLAGVQTNMVYARFDRGAPAALAALRAGGVLAAGIDAVTVRFVLHLDVGEDAVDRTIEIGRMLA
jgi:threonine aldolase